MCDKSGESEGTRPATEVLEGRGARDAGRKGAGPEPRRRLLKPGMGGAWKRLRPYGGSLASRTAKPRPRHSGGVPRPAAAFTVSEATAPAVRDH